MTGSHELSPQTLSLEDRRLLAGWAADCAEHVLALHSSDLPADRRVREAIDHAREFAAGGLDVQAAIRGRGGEAGAAARDAASPAGRAAAYAAEQAAAVAHMGAHALGAAGYAAKAWVLSERPERRDDVLAWVTQQQIALISQTAARAVTRLPLLGENLAGPLGPGRLSTGVIGEAIRAIQARLRIDAARQA